MPVIQVLTSLVALSLLNTDQISRDMSSGAFRNWDPSSYVLNVDAVANITLLFGEAKLLGPSPATPAMFAWSIIAWRLSSQGNAEENARERLIDAPNGSQVSQPPPSGIERSAVVIADLETHDLFDNIRPYRSLADAAGPQFVPLVQQFTDIAVTAFGTHVDQVSRDRIRLIFLQVLRAAMDAGVSDYSAEMVTAICAILEGGRNFRTWVDEGVSRQIDPIVSYFLEDEEILRSVLDDARIRFPYELPVFIRISSVLIRGDSPTRHGNTAFVDRLVDSKQFMHSIPQDFRGYSLVREEENLNFVELTTPFPLFRSASTPASQGQRRLMSSAVSTPSNGLLEMPPGTEGRIVHDSDFPYVALWEFQYSTLTYLVQLISTYPVSSSLVEVFTEQPAACESVSEVISVFADLLHSSLQGSEGICSNELLEALGITLDGGQDTVSIVLAIFEEEMPRLCKDPSNESSLELLVNCTHFLEALAIIAPQRVWPWLARSRLLEGDTNGGGLASILLGTEMVLGRYDFLLGCIRIYKSLVNDAVDRSVARKTPSKALSRFNATASSDSGTSDKIMGTILFTFGRTLASIYESSLSWKYADPSHRPEISVAICDVFTLVIQLAYGVDDAPKLTSKLTKLIAPVAEYIAELYLTKSEGSLPTSPILASLVIGITPDEDALTTSTGILWQRQIRSTLKFADVLVRAAILLQKPWTHLEQQFFKATPLLARLYGSSDKWKSQVVLLLETLVRGAVRVAEPDNATPKTGETMLTSGAKSDRQEPPSLLGHLGPRTAKNFLSVLSQLDEPLQVIDIQTNVWNLLSAVVTCKQQWFSLFLLTGSTPRESMRSKPDASPQSRNRALLKRALDGLTTLKFSERNTALPWEMYTAMLQFVASAQNNWSWAMGDLRKQKDFTQNLLTFLKWMAKQPRAIKTNGELLERSHQNKFAALACEVLSMYLHSSRQFGDITVLKEVVPCLGFLEDNALELPTYNESLHHLLQRRVETRFPGVTLANLKRTTLYPEAFGRNFFYDTELANQLLAFDGAWAGPQEGAGYAGDAEKANYNLGLVESQVQLLQSWKLLTLELSYVVGKDDRVSKILTSVVKKCMVANTESNLPEALFGQLMILRADLAFALLKKLVEAKVQIPEARQLLTPVWHAIRSSTGDFDSVYSSSVAQYYRSLLRILYLALNFQLIDPSAPAADVSFRSSFRGTVPSSHTDFSEAISNQLLEILADTVAKGFRSLANQIHADPSSVSPSDFALLTALLQRVIAIPEMNMWQSQAALLFANNNTVRYATSLFSWSDRLTLGNSDPIYGELSLLFLLSLSTIPALAETMAVDGVLSQLNTANLMNYFRRPNGMGPNDAPARLYSIWVKGILPLCLNLLLSVGPPVAGEISSFLNQYPTQLARAGLALNSSPSSRTHPTKITLSIASECHSLSLITAIIDNVRKQGPKLGIQVNDVAPLDWDKENVKEDVESWLSRKNALMEKVVAMDEREVAMLGRVGEDGRSELETRVVRELEDAGKCLGLNVG